MRRSFHNQFRFLMKETVSTESGKKFRLVVRSAEEAVRIIREKLGENAKVLSVRQVGGEGLKRFVSSPKLEVIAQILEEDVEEALHLENEDKDSNNLSVCERSFGRWRY